LPELIFMDMMNTDSKIYTHVSNNVIGKIRSPLANLNL
jgi:hypothetical protein